MIRPGATQLTVIPCLPISLDRPLDQAWIPALAAKAALSRSGSDLPVMLMMRPKRRAHPRQHRVGELAHPGEVQRDGLVPLLVGRLDRQRPALARAVDQDVDVAERRDRLVADAQGRIWLHHVGDDDRRLAPAGRHDLVRERFQELAPARHHREPGAFGRQHFRDRPPDPRAGAGHERRPPLELQVHPVPPCPLRLPNCGPNINGGGRIMVFSRAA